MGKLETDFAAFVQEPPIIEINANVAIIRHHGISHRAMSVRTLSRISDRIQRALKRHAAGDENIIVDD